MFLGLGFDACHYPHMIPEDIMTRVSEDPQLPPIPDDDFDDIPDIAKAQSILSHERAQDMLGTPKAIDFARHYYGCIAMVDELVGRLMSAVDGSSEKWLVVFTSDHGFHVMDKERTSKYTMWPAVT